MRITKDGILPNLLGIICFIGMIIIFIVATRYAIKEKKLINQYGKYTVGTTIGTTHTTGGFRIEYEFYYNNSKGYGRQSSKKAVKKVNGRYLVLFYPDDLFNNKIFWDKPIPEGINAPPEGWDTIPKFLEELFRQKEIENK